MDAVLARLPADGARPAVACRMAGDSFVLLEYGHIAFDLDLNRYTRRIALAIETADVPGVVDLHSGIRSLLVGFDPAVVDLETLVERLLSLHAANGDEPKPPRIGRRVTLPLAFDDSATREAVARHRATGGPAERDSSDIDDIVRASALNAPSDVRDAVTRGRWCVAFIGYFPGLPFLLPVAGAPPLEVPKLKRLRAWTAEGAVSLGGACLAIFPVEAPGSYRVFGRTVPIYTPEPGAGGFGDDGMLLRAGDLVEFCGVTEQELTECRRKAYEGRYEYQIAERDAPQS